ncbi:unnamed protein product [Amoebophrya sp. A25]|nr:unnamed protein product [Amoebophrya sp. A25]|eukprot:GSA25T00018161001.1
MRVRYLLGHLQEQGLVQKDFLNKLDGFRLAIDAVFWLRSIKALKDPFADAIGGIPPGIFGFVDKELQQLKRAGIKPLFVFEGMAPPAQQMSQPRGKGENHMDMAWSFLANGQKGEAQKCFAVSTSRINEDFVYFLFHHLKSKGLEVFQAPYFAGTQLAIFAEQGLVNGVFGPPGLLLYGVKKCIVQLNFYRGSFDWLDLDDILSRWQIQLPDFVDACMLAGTEYSLTYPYFYTDQYQVSQPGGGGGRFNFDAAITVVKNAPLISWLSTWGTEESRAQHIEGYCHCKVIITHSPVYNPEAGKVVPFSQCTVNAAPVKEEHQRIPQDFANVIGDCLPHELYLLICDGVLSSKLPLALARGVWYEQTAPLVDTSEYRTLVTDLKDYRQRALGRLARPLHAKFHQKRVEMKTYFDPPADGGASSNVSTHVTQLEDGTQIPKSWDGTTMQLPLVEPTPVPTVPILDAMVPEIPVDAMKWCFSPQEVKAELRRQGVEVVDLTFCLRWYAYALAPDRGEGERESLFRPPNEDQRAPVRLPDGSDQETLAAYVYFMVLEDLDLLSPDGGMTVLGNVLKDAPKDFQEPMLIALELMKFGILTGEPCEPAQKDQPFPRGCYPKNEMGSGLGKANILIARAISLLPMKLRADMWNADVSFDMTAFHSMVRVLKRKASVSSLLLGNLELSKVLPNNFMCVTPSKANPLQFPYLLPAFPLPRACLGIVTSYFLNYEGEAATFKHDLEMNFQCCYQGIEDLENGFAFWVHLKKAVDAIAGPLGAEELAHEMSVADQQLRSQCARLSLKIPGK